MYTSINKLVVFGLAAVSNAHMIMNTPPPFKVNLNNSPLNDTVPNFPCKLRGADTYSMEGTTRTNMAIGSKQPLKFTGSAVHGGGSCQISVSYDREPTAKSVWKVIQSYHGGCPAAGVSGNLPENADAKGPTEYTFPIPDIPTGEATLAWTWLNKLGNREFYMNCAPITITAGSVKRDDEGNATMLMERDQSTYDSLPDMFVANLPSVNSVTTDLLAGKDLIFPNPGKVVTTSGDGPFMEINGKDGGPASPAKPSSPAASPTSTTSPTTGAPKPTSPGLPGGVFATVPNPAATQAPAAPATPAAPAQPPSPNASTPASPSASPSPSKSAPSAPASTGSTGSGSALSGKCASEGQWNCVGGTSFQQCASGSWSPVQPMAGGMQCESGQSSTLNMSAKSVAVKRARGIRFSEGHARRNAQI